MVEELQNQGSVSVLNGELERGLAGGAVGEGKIVRGDLGSRLVHFPEHIEERLRVRLNVAVESGKAIHVLPKMSAVFSKPRFALLLFSLLRRTILFPSSLNTGRSIPLEPKWHRG